MWTSLNDSLLPPHHHFFNSDLIFEYYCFISRPYSLIFKAFTITRIILLLPLCIFILYHGPQLWRKKCPASSAGAMSHTDCFTFHLVIMELIAVFGCIICCCANYMRDLNAFMVGMLLILFTWYGEMFFHVLTCVERYLAVVYPTIYLSLKNERWVRIRNISTGCVWLLCFVETGLAAKLTIIVMVLSLLLLSLVIVSFCSLSALCVLIRQTPGERGGVRKRVSQSKKRAFYTIVAILGVLLLRFTWDIIWLVESPSEESDKCLLNAVSLWFNLPGSLVLPLLFLHKAGILVCKSI